LHFIDNQTGFVTGINGVILRTTDGGDTWSDPLNTPTDRTLNGIYFPTPEIGYVAGNGGVILKTTDGGDNWVDVDNPAGTFGLNDVMFTDEENGWVAGVNRLLKTEDGGQTWQQITPAQGISPGNYLSLHLFDENNGIFVGTNGTIQRTEDGGQTFINLNNPAFRTLNSIRFTDNNTGWAVGISGSVIKTTDGGNTWVQQSSGTGVDLFDISAFDVNNAAVVGENSTRIRTTDGGNTWIQTENFRRFRAAFRESGTPASDAIYFLEDSPFDSTNDLVDTWRVSMLPRTASSSFGLTVDPIGGDVLNLQTIKPFTASDRFEFSILDANLPRVDKELAKNQLGDIRVVPNPYLVAHIAEPRGERNIHFTNLPNQCTIRIFTVSGRLVQTLQVDNPVTSDRFVWDMKTNTNDDLPYGVYIYHVRAPGIGETTGKFAVIK